MDRVENTFKRLKIGYETFLGTSLDVRFLKLTRSRENEILTSDVALFIIAHQFVIINTINTNIY